MDDDDKREKKPVPVSPVGTWEVPGRPTGRVFRAISCTVQFRDGKMLYEEPRDPDNPGVQAGCRIEAEYAITKSGRVYGCITSVFGATTVNVGATFSFIPTMEVGSLIVVNATGDQIGGLLGDRGGWKPKP